MSWLAILLTLASLGGTASSSPVKPTVKQCDRIANATKKKQCKKVARSKPKAAPKAKPKKPTTGDQGSPGTAPAPAHRPDAGPGPRGDDPKATPTPAPTATPTPTPAPVVYPSRTGVDLTDTDEWSVRPSYRTLAAGRIDFNANNLGEDDHDLSVRQGARVFGRLPLAPGESETLTLDLAAGSYTLYCSLTGHEEAGMRANITVR